jgi:hypothetical protein
LFRNEKENGQTKRRMLMGKKMRKRKMKQRTKMMCTPLKNLEIVLCM